MLKKTVTYEDLNGNTVIEDFYFNLSKAELLEMELSEKNGYSDMLKSIIAANDNAALVRIFKQLLLSAYGVKSDDGKRFIKSQELREAFEQSPAYSDMFMELATNEQVALAFMKGLVPADIAAEIQGVPGVKAPQDYRQKQPAPPLPTAAETVGIPDDGPQLARVEETSLNELSREELLARLEAQD